jgi:hypothetical protein
LEFLLDPEDTMDAYSDKGKADSSPLKGDELASSADVMNVLRKTGMSHVSLVEVASGKRSPKSKEILVSRPPKTFTSCYSLSLIFVHRQLAFYFASC